MLALSEDLASLIRLLGGQMGRAEVSLFTGAGFSYGAKDMDGAPVPQVDDLRREIWELVWPDEPFDDNSTLQDTFAAALEEGRTRLSKHLRRRLTVDPDSLTVAHETWMGMPWRRAYTVNIDDVETAAGRRFSLPRRIRSHSALTGPLPGTSEAELVVVHLNGTLDDIPDVTFTDPQYGQRLGQPNPLYQQLTAELLSYPVVFVGTTLREPLFWQYLTLRDDRGPRGVREMRPASYLVSPALPPDRRRLLATYNIRWIQMTAAEFAQRVLDQLGDAPDVGLEVLRSLSPRSGTLFRLPTVGELAALPGPPVSEFLMGARPSWSDIREGRAAQRAFESEIPIDSREGAILVTGTAGAGTSTTLMRMALAMVGEDRDVRWIDHDEDVDIRDLGRWLRSNDSDVVVLIDDADALGRGLDNLLADARASLGRVLIVLGMRAVAVDRALKDWRPTASEIEIDVPLLEDQDIVSLLGVLEKDNKLGVLGPLTPDERIERVRKECGRELLVAMFEATTGERFELKVAEEFSQLEAEQRLIYALVAIATDLRAPLLRDEILMASGDLSNTSLYALDRLAARRLIVQDRGRYTLRHRRIAELVVARLRNSVEMLAPYRGLLRAMATRYRSHGTRSREMRLFAALLSHRRIGHTFSVDDARSLYQDLEPACGDDYHYWLQRGSFEVQFGSLSLARLALAQAKMGDGANDHRVHTEWAYYLIKSARKNPTATDAAERVAEGKQILMDYIQGYGDHDPYPWHVYGSQLLGWIRVSAMSDDERARQLRDVTDVVRDGNAKHPGYQDLRTLLKDLEHDLLQLSLPPEQRVWRE
jgi:SIR2-like domain